MAEQRTVTIRKRLRPLRLAFLMRPNDKALLHRICQINTCLWGGAFNPIIPIFTRTPARWAEGKFAPSARSIIAGYLDAFEPDYVVTPNPSLATHINFPSERIVTLTDVLKVAAEDPIGFGVEVPDVHDELYRQEFKFVRRYPIEVILPIFKEKGFSLLGSILMGEFPTETEIEYIKRSYTRALGASERELTAQGCLKILLERKHHYPLSIANMFLKIEHAGRNEPSIFFMQANSVLDMVDFWNLRATGRRILPLPEQWSDSIIAECSKFISEHHRPHPFNKDFMFHTTMICSRSSKFETMEQFYKKLSIPSGSLSLQHWYPRLWEEWAREADGVVRCDLAADDKTENANVSEGRISFGVLEPKFASEQIGRGTPLWANVITLSEPFSIEAAPVIPPRLPSLDRILHDIGVGILWASREGIIVPCSRLHSTRFWKVPSGTAIFKDFMKGAGFDLEISGAGKIAEQVIRTLGSTLAIRLLASEDVIKRLDEMAHGIVESNGDSAGESEVRKPKVRGRTVSVRAWRDLLMKIHDNDAQTTQNYLNNMLNKGIFRRGLQLQCPHCSQRTWFGLEQLAEKLTCERCLQAFPFPLSPPALEDWHYRAVGPFSIENYAQGAYCVALALHFLGPELHDTDITWIPSFTLKKDGAVVLEADFAAFVRQGHYGQRKDPLLVFGECKTFDKFTVADVQRMKKLAETFPGCITTFCTLQRRLTPQEKRNISALASRGRRHLRDEKWRNPVLILTGIELLSRMGPSSCWRDAGPPYSQFGDMNWYRDGLQGVCDWTQQMHLGMEPYSSWYEKERQKRRSRRTRVTGQVSP